MDIVFVTPALAPYSVDVGAAEACAALSKVLRGMGHRPTVVTPLPEEGLPPGSAFSRRLTPARVEIKGEPLELTVYDGRTPGGVEVVFVEHSWLDDLYEEDARGLRAQLLFARAVIALYDEPGAADAFHVHGEEAALACVYLSRAGLAPTILSVHDATDPLRFDPETVREAGAGDLMSGEEGLCPLLEAVRCAGHVTTDAPNRNLATRGQERTVCEAMVARGGALSGILAGLDPAVYNPATDPLLFARFTPMELTGKARNKSMLQRDLELEVDPDVLLLGAVETALGAARILRAAREITRADVQLVVQVLDEDADALDGLIDLSERRPDRLQVRIGDSQTRTHRLLGGCDAVLLATDRPAMAMAAQRYGALPLAARDSQAAELIIDVDAQLKTGTGILYDDSRPKSLVAGARRAHAAFDKREAFDVLRRNIMRLDHSWDRSARLYENLYLTLAEAAE